MILRERDKPKDLTEEEWKMEKRIGNIAFILAGAALFVILALLAAEGAMK